MSAVGGQAERRTPEALSRDVTRGESTNRKQRAKVDWLNCTFFPGLMTIAGVVGFVAQTLKRPLLANESGQGMFGFETKVNLLAYVDSVLVNVGCIAHGGDSQKGRWLLQLTGKGCGLVQDWKSMQESLTGLDATLTRVDLAVDFLKGEYTVDDAVAMHRDGAFSAGGRPPTTSVAGDWLDCLRGRTLYVGKNGNGKCLCVYEKGKQLGDLSSDWVRFELRFGNRDRVLPHDILTNCDQYFAGAYPALAAMVEEAAEPIATTRTETASTLAHLMYHLKRCYGKVIHSVAETTGVNVTDLIEEVRIVGFPRRVQPSGVVAGLSWDQVLSQMKVRA